MLNILVSFMALDYMTGFVAAAVFKKSKKSEGGGLESRSGWKGLCRKGITLLVVLVAYLLDVTAETDFICDTVSAAYVVNELVSIIENVGLMGVPVPEVIVKSIDLLKSRRQLTDLAEDGRKPEAVMSDEREARNKGAQEEE